MGKRKDKAVPRENVAALTDAPYNSRMIDDQALKALDVSMSEFGDLSGFVFNVRTGNLVCGHQRKKCLPPDAKIEDYEEVTDKTGTIGYGYVADEQTRWRVRFVNWPEVREKAANVAANSELLAGRFTADLGSLLEELKINLPDLSEELRLDILIPFPVDFKQEWQGMPEFEQDDISGRVIKVHFGLPEAVVEFAKLIGQPITEKTRAIWYPKQEYQKAPICHEP